MNEENIKLRQRQKELETKALDAINEKRIFQEKLKNVPQDTPQPASEENSEKIDAKEVEELSEAFKVLKIENSDFEFLISIFQNIGVQIPVSTYKVQLSAKKIHIDPRLKTRIPNPNFQSLNFIIIIQFFGI